MQEWISQTLASPTLSLAVVAAAFLLGIVGAVTKRFAKRDADDQ